MPATCQSWQVSSGFSLGFMAAAPTHRSACTAVDDLNCSDCRPLSTQESVVWGISAISLCVQPQSEVDTAPLECYDRDGRSRHAEQHHSRNSDSSHGPIVLSRPRFQGNSDAMGKSTSKEFVEELTMDARPSARYLSEQMTHADGGTSTVEICRKVSTAVATPHGFGCDAMGKTTTRMGCYKPIIEVRSDALQLTELPPTPCASGTMIMLNAAEGKSAAPFNGEMMSLPTGKVCSSSAMAIMPSALHLGKFTSCDHAHGLERFPVKGCFASSKSVGSGASGLIEHLTRGYCKTMASSTAKLSEAAPYCDGISTMDAKSKARYAEEYSANIHGVDLSTWENRGKPLPGNVLPVISTHLTSKNQENAVRAHSLNSTRSSLAVVQEDQPWDCLLTQESDTESRVSSSTLSFLSVENAVPDNSSSNADTEVQSSYNGRMEFSSSLRSTSPPRKGLSRFYAAKSRSFTCLGDVVSLEDIVKPDNPYAKRRKYSSSKRTNTSLDRPQPSSMMKNNVSISDLGSLMEDAASPASGASFHKHKRQRGFVSSRSYSLSDLRRGFDHSSPS